MNIGATDEAAAYRLMDYALDRRITFFDTAEEYPAGGSERIVGNWLRRTGCRDQITLCTKVLDGAGNIHAALEASLDRLGTDQVDIYLMHELVPSPPLDEIPAALEEEARAGACANHRIGNYTPAQLEPALQISRSGLRAIRSPPTRVQPHHGPGRRQPSSGGMSELEDQPTLPLAERERIAVTTYSPLGNGLLTGKYTHERPLPPDARFEDTPRVAYRFTERNFRILESLRSCAQAFL